MRTLKLFYIIIVCYNDIYFTKGGISFYRQKKKKIPGNLASEITAITSTNCFTSKMYIKKNLLDEKCVYNITTLFLYLTQFSCLFQAKWHLDQFFRIKKYITLKYIHIFIYNILYANIIICDLLINFMHISEYMLLQRLYYL